MTSFDERFAAASDACTVSVLRGPRRTPAAAFSALAAACSDFGITKADWYGAEGGAVELLEARVAALLGKPAAVFLPTGTMAQQAVLRVWCERRGSWRVALPDLAHPVTHEQDGPRLLHGFRFEHLTTGRTVATAAHLAAVTGDLGAAMIELPLREAGCIAPTWDELQELSTAARERGVPLHVDGARLWEVAPFYEGRALADLAGLVDSVYVSFYKGLGAFAGAAVAAAEDVVADVRRWRRRQGGEMFQMTPYALSALLALRDELPRMGECVAWARTFAAAANGLRVHPEVPQSTTFVLYADRSPEEINDRLLAFLEQERANLCARWRPTEVPGFAQCEVTVTTTALAHDPVHVAELVAKVALG
ncbi:threonine aldolase family protein [Pseudonocardia sp. CA-107938]|uniref:threonine aldolase family protein n=1 Tax=Pseudonocardia sp. CA-107938 TaxID=3240021 RepID=UPI003D8EC0FF